jgi:heptosyltransferase-2
MKILIELPTWLGDAVMSTPAIENMISLFSDIEIHILSFSNTGDLFINHPNVKNIHKIEKNFKNFIFYVANMDKDYDMFLSFRSSPRSIFYKFFVNAKKKYQFSKFRFSKGHQVEKYNSFINHIFGVNLLPKNLKLYSKNTIVENKSYICGINPGAKYGSAKCWQPNKFAELAFLLSKKFQIIIYGGKNDTGVANLIEKKVTNLGVTNIRNIAGKTSIMELVESISSLDLFITGDSGPMHIAAALGIPTISIFGPTKPNETSQWMNSRSFIVKKNFECQPCMKRVCPYGHHKCMNEINVKEVEEKVIDLFHGDRKINET